MSGIRRALHFVFKVADRTSTIAFYRNVLAMKVLRHEEFEEGCKAACNGPYDGKWSKTMMGYGDEDTHFVVELTYNYGIKNYQLGNDFQYIAVFSKSAYANALKTGSSIKRDDGGIAVMAPGGYTYRVYNQEPVDKDPVQSVCLSVSDMTDSVVYWERLLGMKVYSQTADTVTLGYADSQAKLMLQQLTVPLSHGEAYGRIAFSCPSIKLPDIEKTVSEAGHKILTPLVSLDTPGKATVQVVILADPDGHEICFVGDEAFRELSKTDPQSDQLLNEAMSSDKSVEWFEAKERKKQAAKRET